MLLQEIGGIGDGVAVHTIYSTEMCGCKISKSEAVEHFKKHLHVPHVR